MKYVYGVLVLLLLMNLSCTREVEQPVSVSIDTSKLQKGFSSNPSAQTIPAGFYPAIIMANLHYDGKTEVQEWECPYKNSQISSCQFPSSINFNGKTFPNGANRSVQVLLIYENAMDELIFYYADALNLTFQGGSMSITLASWTNNGGSPGTGNVAGRFFDPGTNTGPSGKLIGYYTPPPAASGQVPPKMKLFDRYMLNGYFNVFFLKGGMKFSWVLHPEGSAPRNVFYNKSFDDFTSTIAGKAAVYFKSPEYYSVYYDGSKNKSELEASEGYILGFFDANDTADASVKLMSYSGTSDSQKGFVFSNKSNVPATTGVIDYAYRYTNNSVNPINSAGEWVDPNDGDTNCSPAYATCDDAWETNYKLGWSLTQDPNKVSIQGGSVNASSSTVPNAPCELSASDAVNDHCFTIHPSEFSRTRLVPFRGAFQLQIVSPSDPYEFDFLKFEPDQTDPTNKTGLSWKYLPGVLGSSVSGTDIYVVDRNVIDDENDDSGLNCTNVGLWGANHLGTVSSTNPNDQHFNLLNSQISSYQSADQEIVVCPYKMLNGQKKYIPSGVKSYGLWVPNAGTSSININNGNLAPTLAYGTCLAISHGYSLPLNGTSTITVESNANILSHSSGCAGLTSQITVTSYATETSFTYYLDTTQPGSYAIDISGVGVDSFDSFPTYNFSITNPPEEITMTVAGDMSENMCATVEAEVLNPVSNAFGLDVNVSSGIPVQLYNDPSCTSKFGSPTANFNINIPYNQTNSTIYFKASVAADMNFTFNFSVTDIAYEIPSPNNVANINITNAQNYIFASNTTFHGNFGGRSAADDQCQTMAESAGLGGGYKALMSDNSFDIKQYMTGVSYGPFKRPSGASVAFNVSGLFSAALSNAVNEDENGSTIASGSAWTGLTTGGEPEPNNNCNDWNDNTTSFLGQAGDISMLGTTWYNDVANTCDMMKHIYCVEVDPY